MKLLGVCILSIGFTLLQVVAAGNSILKNHKYFSNENLALMIFFLLPYARHYNPLLIRNPS